MLRRTTISLATALFVFTALNVAAQNTWVPPNFTLETGTFQNWKIYTGVDMGLTQALNLTPPLEGQHEIITPAETGKDRWSGITFPYPDGGNTFKLGSRSSDVFLDRLSYTFTVPAGEKDFTLIYQYAVAFALDGQCYNKAPIKKCIADLQPYFKVELYNVTDDSYVDCAYRFVASPDSTMTTTPVPLVVKAYSSKWETVMANIKNAAGKTYRLDFSTSHCSYGRHFMYAYIHLNQTRSKLTGGSVCTGMKEISLKAPEGFKKYNWFNPGSPLTIGSKAILKLNPPPAPDKVYAVEMESDEGCKDTFYTTIRQRNAVMDLKVNGPVLGCEKPGVNLTAPSVTSGSSPGLSFRYYADTSGNVRVQRASAITQTGRYLIEAENDSGCVKMEPIEVVVYKRPNLVAPDTIFGCSSQLLDITNPYITNGSDTVLRFTYPLDMYSPSFLPDPKAIAESGLYFIRASNLGGCVATKGVYAFFAELKTNAQVSCGAADLTLPSVTEGTTPGYSFSYWMDSLATTSLLRPDSVTTGIYYIRGMQNSGCTTTLPVRVRMRLNAQFTLTNPPVVSYPASINLTSTVSSPQVIKYSYWRDASATASIAYPNAIQKSGTYYVKGISTEGCSVVKPVVVNVVPPPPVTVIAPNAFSPNGDGINDEFTFNVKGVEKIESFSVFNRWGQVVFHTTASSVTWKGDSNGKILPIGTYYWSLEGSDRFNGKVMKTGSVTIVK